MQVDITRGHGLAGQSDRSARRHRQVLMGNGVAGDAIADAAARNGNDVASRQQIGGIQVPGGGLKGERTARTEHNTAVSRLVCGGKIDTRDKATCRNGRAGDCDVASGQKRTSDIRGGIDGDVTMTGDVGGRERSSCHVEVASDQQRAGRGARGVNGQVARRTDNNSAGGGLRHGSEINPCHDLAGRNRTARQRNIVGSEDLVGYGQAVAAGKRDVAVTRYTAKAEIRRRGHDRAGREQGGGR